MQARVHTSRSQLRVAIAVTVTMLVLAGCVLVITNTKPLFAVTEMARTSAAMTSLPPKQATVTSAEPLTATAKAIDDMLQRLDAADRFDGVVLVADKDGILLQKAYGTANFEWDVPHTLDSIFRIGSVTKPFTALAILQLAEQGKLHLDDSICQYFDPCPEAWKPVTIHHLLNHTSGIPDSLAFNGEWPPMRVASKELFLQSSKLEMDYAPGAAWNYCNVCYLLLGEIIHSASGKGYVTYITDNILKPSGLKTTGFDDGRRVLHHGVSEYDSDLYVAEHYEITNLGAAGAMYSTVEDLYRLDQALYGESLVSKALLEGTWEEHSPALVSSRDPTVRNLHSEFAMEDAATYGWFLKNVHGHERLGVGMSDLSPGATLDRFPNEHVTIIVLGNRFDQETSTVAQLIEDILFMEKP